MVQLSSKVVKLCFYLLLCNRHTYPTRIIWCNYLLYNAIIIIPNCYLKIYLHLGNMLSSNLWQIFWMSMYYCHVNVAGGGYICISHIWLYRRGMMQSRVKLDQAAFCILPLCHSINVLQLHAPITWIWCMYPMQLCSNDIFQYALLCTWV